MSNVTGVSPEVVPAYAMVDGRVFCDWMEHTAQWGTSSVVPYLQVCPLCAAVTVAEFPMFQRHIVWHAQMLGLVEPT